MCGRVADVLADASLTQSVSVGRNSVAWEKNVSTWACNCRYRPGVRRLVPAMPWGSGWCSTEGALPSTHSSLMRQPVITEGPALVGTPTAQLIGRSLGSQSRPDGFGRPRSLPFPKLILLQQSQFDYGSQAFAQESLRLHCTIYQICSQESFYALA